MGFRTWTIAALLLLVSACAKESGPPAPPTTGQVITLPSGAKVSLPADATKLLGRPGTFSYFVPRGTYLLFREQPALGGCAAFLKNTFEQNQAKGADAELKRVNKLDRVEWREVAGRKSIFAAGGTRTPYEAKINAEYHANASLVACLEDAALTVSVSQKSGSLSPWALELLNAVTASLTPR